MSDLDLLSRIRKIQSSIEKLQQFGVIVGADMHQQWLLPWWYSNYKKHNSYPVVFFDFGLSSHMKLWCKERGTCIEVPMLDPFIADQSEVNPEIGDGWNQKYGPEFWNSRYAWFKKPIACFLSPFDKTLWLDLDCEVMGDLRSVFEGLREENVLGLVRDRGSFEVTYPIYNSGVIIFARECPLIDLWMQESLKENIRFRGDQDLLSFLIAKNEVSVQEFPSIYNTSVYDEEIHSSVILHYIGGTAKNWLRSKIGLNDF